MTEPTHGYAANPTNAEVNELLKELGCEKTESLHNVHGVHDVEIDRLIEATMSDDEPTFERHNDPLVTEAQKIRFHLAKANATEVNYRGKTYYFIGKDPLNSEYVHILDPTNQVSTRVPASHCFTGKEFNEATAISRRYPGHLSVSDMARLIREIRNES
ncbi:hypothetical protein VPHF86_0222 [Vibrio phage F86]